MIFIVLFFILFLLLFCPHLRIIILNPLKSLINSIKDLYMYFRYRKWNVCKEYGFIDMYCSDTSKVFGNGKTCSGVNRCLNISKKFNNKLVYDFDNKEWAEQHVFIMSNVIIDVPNFIYLKNATQITEFHKFQKPTDVLIVFVDECGILFNSRNYKENIGAELLNSMLTCRKKKFGMILTAQRFNQVDALIRQLTSRVIMCDKLWRAVVLRVFNGYDMEYCTNPNLLTHRTTGYFATNNLFNSYDTNQGVEDLRKKVENGEMLTDYEILESLGNDNGTIENVRSGNRKFKRRWKK